MAIKIATGVDLNSQRAQNAADPQSATDLATKQYVDNLSLGMAWKAPCRVATTTNITLSGLQTIDGIAVSAADRVLVKDQTTGSQNGIYIAAAGAWARATDADSAAELVNAVTSIDQGTVNADKMFVQAANAPLTLGTTPLVWATLSGGLSYSAGAGLTLASQTFSIDTSVVARRYSAAIGDGSSTSIVVAHGLGTRDITWSLQDVSTGAFVWTDGVVGTSSPFNLTLTFPSAPTSGQYRVTVTG